MRLFLVFLGMALSVSSAQAEFRIDDPQGIIAQADAFLGPLTFADSFRVGDQMAGESRFCRIVNGKESCFPAVMIQSTVREVLADKAIMLTVTSEDEEGSDWVVMREVFEKVKGNFIVLYFVTGFGGDKPGDRDFVVVESGVLGEHTLANGQVVPSFTATMTQNIWQAATQSYIQKHVALTIGKDLPAVSQLLKVQPDPQILKTPVFQLTGFKRTP